MVGLAQKLPLGGENRLAVRFGASKGAHARQFQDASRLPPLVEGEEHVRPHQQPQLIPRPARRGLLQGIGGVALALPVQLGVPHLDGAGHKQLVGGDPRHLQPLLQARTARGQLFMGGDPRRDEYQPVQPQGGHGRPGRRQMPQVGGVEAAAVDADSQWDHPLS